MVDVANEKPSFSLAEISEGDHFTYLSRGRVVCGFIGEVKPHDDGKLAVIRNDQGEEICHVNRYGTVWRRGGTVIVAGGSTTFCFTPAYPATILR